MEMSFHSSVHMLHEQAKVLISPNICCFPISSNVHSLDGENLLGGTPLVAWVDLLNTVGDEMEGCVTPGELVGMSFLMGCVPLSLNCGVTRLPVSKAGCSSPGSID